MRKKREFPCDLVEVGNATVRTLGYAGNYCESNQRSPCQTWDVGCEENKACED